MASDIIERWKASAY